MTKEEIISGLKFTVEMFLYEPSTGEIITEPRNSMDKTTIDACRGAIELLEQEPKWIHVSKSLPKKDGNYLIIYEKGYAEDYDLPPIGIAGFEADCESFGYWYEHFDRKTLGCLGSEWEEIKVMAWMPLQKLYDPQEDKEKEE